MAPNAPTPTSAPTHPSLSRRLKVSYGPHSVRDPEGRPALTPFLRLQGAWLERAGFSIGAPVRVRVSTGRLIIEALAPETQCSPR
ncbi:MAG: type I toxin-antitoxin system SymE family toxin [Proteobacteria bacterium]|nr:type I toxin-antitoxin system SymE family toxin [Pseudomonadota bacterium]